MIIIIHMNACSYQAMSSFGCGGMKPPAVVVPPPYSPPGTGGVAAGGLPLPPAALAPGLLAMARGHVVRRPGVVLAPAPPPAMAPFGALLPLAHHSRTPSCCCCGHDGAPVRKHADEPAGSRSQRRQNNSISGDNVYVCIDY